MNRTKDAPNAVVQRTAQAGYASNANASNDTSSKSPMKAPKLLEIDLVDDADRYSTLAGFILWQMGHLPVAGEKIRIGDFDYEVVALDGRAIDKVRIRPVTEGGAA